MYNLFFPAAIWIDNHALTDQGREPVGVVRDERSSSTELANGTRKRYIKAVKRSWSLSWTWVPDLDEQTIDGAAGRQTMVELVGDSGEAHLLRFYDRNGEWKEYRVFCNDYSENLVKRDPQSGTFWWEISMELEEA